MKRKLSIEKLRPTSIRTQIILGFGIILGLTLLIAVINLVALQVLQTNIEATIQEASRIRELSQEFENQFLLARQEEKAFLDNWRTLGYEMAAGTHVAASQEHVANARRSLEELRQLVDDSPYQQLDHISEELAALGPALDGYEAAFLETAEKIGDRSRAGGSELRLQNAKRDVEELASTIPNSIQLNRTIVQMDASEQAFFGNGHQEHVDQARLLTLKTKDLLNHTPHLDWAYSDMARPLLVVAVGERQAAFGELVQLEQEIGINAAIFQEITSEISELTGHIGEDAAEALAEGRTNLTRAVTGSSIVSIVASLAALAIGVLTAWVLGRRILDPLNELTEASTQIGEGNLMVTVPVSGQDEFATLGQAFNQMAEQLRDLIGSLERRVADRTRALSTSFQVSRRLSTILDQEQLIAEVVKQVQSAFDYYHAHIYLVDDWTGQLLMVGGTGEAGQAMLVAGHKLTKGQGLVGRAAETRKPVIVPDVSQDPQWFPNPLLPGTRAEIAVPIMLGNQVKGVLDVQHDVRDGLNKTDAELLQTIANQVAIALQNAKLYEHTQQVAEREATVNSINQKIQQAATIENVLEIAAQELGKALGKKSTTVQLGFTTRNKSTLASGHRLTSKQSKGIDSQSKNGPAKNGYPPELAP
jgi:GAF domain-containing protein